MASQRANKMTYSANSLKEKLANLLQNRYLRIILISFVIASIMVMTLFGIYGIIIEKVLPVPHYSVLLFIFAVIFILIFEFFDSKKIVNKLGSGVLGFVCAFCLTVIITAIIQSVKMIIFKTYQELGIGWEMVSTGIAIFMIISVIGIKVLLAAIEKD